MPSINKYARIENERRFLLSLTNEELIAMNLPKRVILDNYIIGTNLRLREVDNEGQKVYKLTKKTPLSSGREEITTIYLSQEEYQLLSKMHAMVIYKVRFIMTYNQLIIGIDCYSSGEDELWVGEVEFETVEQMDAFVMPIPYQMEITGKDDSSGLALANRFGFINQPF